MQGILICAAALVLGGLLGTRFGNLLSEGFKQNLLQIFALVNFCIAGTFVVRNTSLMAVTFALLVGGSLGYVLRFETRVEHAAARLIAWSGCAKGNPDAKAQFSIFLTMVCASCTGILGSITVGMEGDQSLFYVKAVLDFPYALLFAALIGVSVCFVCIPEVILFSLLFVCARFLAPFMTAESIGNLYACGGLILLASGLRLIGVKKVSTINLLPSLICIVPITLLLQ